MHIRLVYPNARTSFGGLCSRANQVRRAGLDCQRTEEVKSGQSSF